MDWDTIRNLKSKINTSSRQRQIIKDQWDRIITMIVRKVSMDLIAKEIGVSERTLWRVLKELGISTNDIIKAYEEYQKSKEQKALMKLEKVKAPPTSYTQFKELEVIKEFIRYCTGRRGVGRSAITNYLRIIYRACKELMVHPDSLDKEIIEKYLEDIRINLGELIRDPMYKQSYSEIVTAFRVWGEFKGFSISFKTSEYHGIWNVYFTRDDLRNLREIAFRIFKRDQAEFITTILEMYIRTCMRAKAITKIKDVQVQNDRVIFTVEEKGKKERYLWIKSVPRELWERFSKYNITEKTLRKIRSMLIKLYAYYFNLDPKTVEKIKRATLFGSRVIHRREVVRGRLTGKLLREDIVETPSVHEVLKELREKIGHRYTLVYYAIRHPIHVLRHTGAILMLEACDWNYSIVRVLGGWVKTETLEQIYGRLEYLKALELFNKYNGEQKAFGVFKS